LLSGGRVVIKIMDIGAFCTIERVTGDTTIGEGTKLTIRFM
jgi:hypothetical protein